MFRRALLVALVVCSMGILFAAVQPVSADVLSETPTPDGADGGSDAPADGSGDDGTEADDGGDDEMDGSGDGTADDEDDGWYDGWESDDDWSENGSEDDGEDTDDGSDWDDDGSDWDDDGTDDGASNASASSETDGDGNTSHDGGDQPAGADDERGGTDRQNQTQRQDDPEATDGSDGDGEGNRTGGFVGRVLHLPNETVGSITDSVAGDLDGDGDPEVELVAVEDGSVRIGALTGESADGADGSGEGVSVLEVELDEEFVDDRGRLRAGNVTIAGTLVVPLGPPEIVAPNDADEVPTDRPGLDAPSGSDATAEARPSDGPTAVTVAGSDADGNDGTAEIDDESEATTDADTDGQGGAGDVPEGGAGAGAALVVTVGLLGGTRTTLDQTALLASQGSGTTLTTLRHAVAGYLDELSGGVLLGLFGYSRRDGSDPLENDTRADIYDVVRESPGTYHAQLAEETGVAVETVRYHSRILAEEGLVEVRKIRGRRRLFPVTMDDDDPELAAAIADSAASDVLSVIERREPTTLSAIAEAVDCAPSTVSYHVDRLEDDGLVSRERDGGAVRVRLRRSTRSALQGRVADD